MRARARAPWPCPTGPSFPSPPRPQILAAALEPLKSIPAVFVLVYGLTFFFANFGPNMTTFVIPAEAFPTAARATCHGISAASGKIGAALGAAAMAPLLTIYGSDTASKDKGLAVVLAICSALGALGTLWTWFFTAETRDIALTSEERQPPRRR